MIQLSAAVPFDMFSSSQMPEFHQRVGVLQQLGYVSPDGTVTLKGRAACEINSTQVRKLDGGIISVI